jgi:hypothetical protein
VRSKHNLRFYAIKVLNKAKVHKTKQVEHTNNEQRLLEAVQHPFIINLWGTFQDSSNLYMVMDFVPGGELFTLLRRSNVSRIIPYVFVHTPIYFPAISGPRRKVLRRRSRPCSESSPHPRYHLPRPQARKYSPERRRPCQDRRLRFRKALSKHDLDVVWDTRLPSAGGSSQPFSSLLLLTGYADYRKEPV